MEFLFSSLYANWLRIPLPTYHREIKMITLWLIIVLFVRCINNTASALPTVNKFTHKIPLLSQIENTKLHCRNVLLLAKIKVKSKFPGQTLDFLKLKSITFTVFIIAWCSTCLRFYWWMLLICRPMYFGNFFLTHTFTFVFSISLFLYFFYMFYMLATEIIRKKFKNLREKNTIFTSYEWIWGEASEFLMIWSTGTGCTNVGGLFSW